MHAFCFFFKNTSSWWLANTVQQMSLSAVYYCTTPCVRTPQLCPFILYIYAGVKSKVKYSNCKRWRWQKRAETFAKWQYPQMCMWWYVIAWCFEHMKLTRKKNTKQKRRRHSTWIYQCVIFKHNILAAHTNTHQILHSYLVISSLFLAQLPWIRCIEWNSIYCSILADLKTPKCMHQTREKERGREG